MTKEKQAIDWEQAQELKRIRSAAEHAPWVLRITEHKDKPAPVLVVKERFSPEENNNTNGKPTARAVLKDRGLLYGQSLRRSLLVIRNIITGVCDDDGIPLELQRFISNGRFTFRGNLPLDDEAGVKLSLIFKLQERIKDMNRVELIAWRVERFSREEAQYWLSRVTQYGNAANRWAQAGMRIMLGGQPDDKAIQKMLEKLRR